MADGSLNFLTGTDPAANTEISQTLTPFDTCRLQMFKVTLVTDGTAATRTVTFRVTASDGTTVLFEKAAPTQAASLTRNYFFYADLVTEDAAFDGAGNVKLRIPSNRWPRGAKLVTSTANRQTGDNFGAPLIFVEEWH